MEQNVDPRPQAHQRVAAELIGQRNQALDALAQVAAELGATRDALAAAEARTAELETQIARLPALDADTDPRLKARLNPLGTVAVAVELQKQLSDLDTADDHPPAMPHTLGFTREERLARNAAALPG